MICGSRIYRVRIPEGPGFCPAVTNHLKSGVTGRGQRQKAVILSEAKNLPFFAPT
jgi:hypothetical protein